MNSSFDAIIQRAKAREVQYPEALVSVFDRQGFYCHVTAVHERILGYQRDELLGMHWTEMIHRDDLHHVHLLRTMAELQPDQPIAMDFRAVTKSGRAVQIHGTVTFVRLGDDSYLLTTSNAQPI
jgi:PAS domain S-box-containing protein